MTDRAKQPSSILYASGVECRETRELSKDATLRVRPGCRGFSVEAMCGTLLVTQAGDADDHILTPGDVFQPAPRRGLVVIWALSKAAVRLYAYGRSWVVEAPLAA